MNWWPFSRLGVETALNIAVVWMLLEAMRFHLGQRPPWRTARADLALHLMLGIALVLLGANVMAWLLSYTRT